jgi:hypothetical protein
MAGLKISYELPFASTPEESTLTRVVTPAANADGAKRRKELKARRKMAIKHLVNSLAGRIARTVMEAGRIFERFRT